MKKATRMMPISSRAKISWERKKPNTAARKLWPIQADGVFAAHTEVTVNIFAQVREIRRDDAAGQHEHRQEDDEVGTSSAMLRVMLIA